MTHNRRYHSRRYTQIRLRRLWDLGYLERSGLPPPSGIGGSPYVYRLAPAAIARLGYAPRPRRGAGYDAHTLLAVERGTLARLPPSLSAVRS